MRDRLPLLALSAALSLTACRQAFSTVFDIPPPRPAVAGPAARAATQTPLILPADTVRLPIERFLEPDSVRPLLPRDHAGNIDWAEALRAGVIAPRRVLPGRTPPADGFRFGFDFSFPGPDTTFDARFPHSTHTEWLACAQCHDRIFPYRGNTIRMADVFQGKFCGECHGRVAFPVMTACERCHVRLQLPADRAQPELLGTLRLARHDSNATVASTGELPAAQFPHWVHRIRYRCSACHMELFEPRNGANRVTMAQISAGEKCGVCHNGRDAFRATIGTCQRCHLAEPTVTPTAG